jgi:hypothetical protein
MLAWSASSSVHPRRTLSAALERDELEQVGVLLAHREVR